MLSVLISSLRIYPRLGNTRKAKDWVGRLVGRWYSVIRVCRSDSDSDMVIGYGVGTYGVLFCLVRLGYTIMLRGRGCLLCNVLFFLGAGFG